MREESDQAGRPDFFLLLSTVSYHFAIVYDAVILLYRQYASLYEKQKLFCHEFLVAGSTRPAPKVMDA